MNIYCHGDAAEITAPRDEEELGCSGAGGGGRVERERTIINSIKCGQNVLWNMW